MLKRQKSSLRTVMVFRAFATGLLSNGSHAAGKLLRAVDQDGFDRTAACQEEPFRLRPSLHVIGTSDPPLQHPQPVKTRSFCFCGRCEQYEGSALLVRFDVR